MSKMLNIALVDVDGPLHMPAYCMDWSTLSEEECSNILHAMNFHHPTIMISVVPPEFKEDTLDNPVIAIGTVISTNNNPIQIHTI